MRFSNNGKGTSNILQNQFTRYLKTAIHRKRIDMLRKRKKICSYEYNDNDFWTKGSVLGIEDIYFRASPQFESTALEQALLQIEARDRYIFCTHVLDARTFNDLAAELCMSYKGVAAAYYRVIRIIRERMRGEIDEF